MDTSTILETLDIARWRLNGILDTIEKSGQDQRKVLSWRPGPGRAHIAWQAMHLAATYDRYFNVRIKGGEATDPQLVANFGGGSKPSDDLVPSLSEIRTKLEANTKRFRDYLASASPEELDRMIPFPGGGERSVGASALFLAWHEAHHQGQIHLTWNLYKAAHGIA